MKIKELEELIDGAHWFTRLGQYDPEEGFLKITHFDDQTVDEDWDWLPTTDDSVDPIHNPRLKDLSVALGKSEERRKASLACYKRTLISLRSVPNRVELLARGPYNGTPAAKGGALYAVRMAAAEIVLQKQGFWCSMIPVYHAGYWPCGLTDYSRKVIVF